MYLKIIRPWPFKPKISLTNQRVLFFTDYSDPCPNDSFYSTGADIIHDPALVPWVIIERLGDVVFYHQLIQETDRHISFAPLRPVATTRALLVNGWCRPSTVETYLYRPTIQRHRSCEVEHANLAFLQKLLDNLQFKMRMDHRYYGDAPRAHALRSLIDDCTLTLRTYLDRDLQNPVMRTASYLGQSGLVMLEEIDNQLDMHPGMPQGVIRASKRIMHDTSSVIADLSFLKGSAIAKQLFESDKLTRQDLDKLLQLYPNRNIVLQKQTEDPGDNTISEQDIHGPEALTVIVAEIHLGLMRLVLPDITLVFKREEDGKFTSLTAHGECPEEENPEKTPISKFKFEQELGGQIASLSKVFDFYPKIVTCTVRSTPYSIQFEYKLKDGETKTLTYSAIMSSLASAAMTEI